MFGDSKSTLFLISRGERMYQYFNILKTQLINTSFNQPISIFHLLSIPYDFYLNVLLKSYREIEKEIRDKGRKEDIERENR